MVSLAFAGQCLSAHDKDAIFPVGALKYHQRIQARIVGANFLPISGDFFARRYCDHAELAWIRCWLHCLRILPKRPLLSRGGALRILNADNAILRRWPE